jgi:3-isopropylmalate/(R)-2-methylmalate dehydratase small subunit
MSLLHEKISYEIRACAIAVRKDYGSGHKEEIYQRALREELTAKNLKFKKEEPIEIFSPKSGKVVGIYRPDFIVEDKIIVELKSLKSVPRETVNQLYTYLRNSQLELGFLINFGGARLIIKRIVYSNNRKPWFKRLLPRNSASTPWNIAPRNEANSTGSISAFIRGRSWCFGHDIDTDQIYPSKYLPLTDKAEMVQHAMEGVPEGEIFIKKVKPGDILVAGKNFGCGSSREHAAVAIRGAGISVIIAQSFARIFYRNCVNMALPILELKEAKAIKTGDELEVNIETGEIRDLTTGQQYRAQPVSGLEMEIMHAGGLLEYLKSKNSLTTDVGTRVPTQIDTDHSKINTDVS